MDSQNKKKLAEEVTKTSVDGQIKTYISSSEFKTKIEKIVQDRLKNNKELEDKVVEITKNVLTQLYKTLWTKRGLWQNNLTNKNS
jgi:uncharacterized protein YaaW (UPF0174 family)